MGGGGGVECVGRWKRGVGCVGGWKRQPATLIFLLPTVTPSSHSVSSEDLLAPHL